MKLRWLCHYIDSLHWKYAIRLEGERPQEERHHQVHQVNPNERLEYGRQNLVSCAGLQNIDHLIQPAQ